ncbi:MAG: M24 family metallopeptidase [Spirochaetaceae bacterium]|nr:M24 family metallopeptidase [Spirochaetaceae bacterium]
MINIDINKIKKAILKENLSGWLFFNFKHRDSIADLLLEIDKKAINSRGWFYIITAEKENIKIVHSVEPDALKEYPGKTIIYTSKEELKAILKQFSGMCFAVQADNNLTQISFLDSGTASILCECGIKIASSASLIKEMLGNLDKEQISMHEKAADSLYKIMDETWEYLSINFKKSKKITESLIQSFILERFEKNSLITNSPPLVAFGKNSANPHYNTPCAFLQHPALIETPSPAFRKLYRSRETNSPATSKSAVLKKNTIIQFDIWAKCRTQNLKEPGDKCVYADISWVGFSGSDCPDEIVKSFNAVAGARDSVIAFIKENIKAGKEVSGFDADKKARNFLFNFGYKKEDIKHRTGHAIDIELHGYGTNLDSIEFPDKRILSNGSCFSVEPGLYFKDFGIRTEINCYIIKNKLYVSGGIPQNDIFMI